MSTPPQYDLGVLMPTQPKRSRAPWIVAGIAALAAVAAVATAVGVVASGDDATPAAATSSSPSAAPVQEVKVGKLYFSIAELRDDVEAKTSMRCTTYNEIPNPTGAIARAECTEQSGFGLFNDKTEAEASARSVGEMVAGGLGDASIHVVGQNWTVNCGSDRPLCEQVQAGLGGDLLVIEAG
jgi:hypothetical protein